MNDLLQLRTDMKERYAEAVQSRKSLRELEEVVSSLAAVLETRACRVIRPENVYWAVMSNAIAGAVEHAKALLREAAEIVSYPKPFRFLLFWCVHMGIDAEIDDLRNNFSCISKVANMSENRSLYQEKVDALRKVNTLGFISATGYIHKGLSNIKEETITVA